MAIGAQKKKTVPILLSLLRPVLIRCEIYLGNPVKIQFINPPFLGRFRRSQRSPGVTKSGTMYYPYWLAHAAAVAEERGHEIHLIDCPAGSKNVSDLLEHCVAFQPDILVLESVTASWYSDCEIAAHLKKKIASCSNCHDRYSCHRYVA